MLEAKAEWQALSITFFARQLFSHHPEHASPPRESTASEARRHQEKREPCQYRHYAGGCVGDNPVAGTASDIDATEVLENSRLSVN